MVHSWNQSPSQMSQHPRTAAKSYSLNTVNQMCGWCPQDLLNDFSKQNIPINPQEINKNHWQKRVNNDRISGELCCHLWRSKSRDIYKETTGSRRPSGWDGDRGPDPLANPHAKQGTWYPYPHFLTKEIGLNVMLNLLTCARNPDLSG